MSPDTSAQNPDRPADSRRSSRTLRTHLAAGLAVTPLLLLGVAGMTDARPDAPCAGEPGCLTVERLARDAVLDEAYHIHDRHGDALAMVGGTTRRWTPMDSIPARVRDAWIAVEDRRFREHGGVDLRGAARAAVVNVAGGGVLEGASTIPMQLVRVLWADDVLALGSWERKLYETRMAPRLVDELGRERVLELYLNGIYLGEGVHGIGAASRHYFGVTPAELSLPQLAALVGLTKTPARYNPRTNPERARTRRNVVLDIMHREGIIDAAERDAAKAAPVEVVETPPVRNARDYVSAAVRQELARVAPELVGRDGLRIHTTVDGRAQAEATRLMAEHLARVEAGEMGAWLAGAQPVQGGFIAIESSTGAILAVVGGRSFSETELNRPLQARRQVGSLVKPLLLGTMARSGLDPARALSTAPIHMETSQGVWSPRDHVDEPWLLPRDMVVRSSNRAAVRLGQEVGVGRFSDFAASLGIRGEIPQYPSSFLGSFDASLSEMTAAYAAFENGGRQVVPHLITRVEDAWGRVVWERPTPSEPRRVLAEEEAYVVLDAMRGVVEGGTGWRVRQHVRGPAAGKTGTTNDGADAWFVGVRPGVAAGVWVGLDRPGEMVSGASGGTLAAPLWGRWASAMEAEWGPGDDWRRPASLERVALEVRDGPRGVRVCRGEAGRTTLLRAEAAFRVPSCGPDRRSLDRPDFLRNLDLRPLRPMTGRPGRPSGG